MKKDKVEDLKTYTPGAVVNYFLEKYYNAGISVTPLVIQKMLYFAHGEYLAKNKCQKLIPLINEPFQAWEHGLMQSTVYYEFKRFGMGPITVGTCMKEVELTREPLDLKIVANTIPKTDKETIKFLDDIWDRFSNIDIKVLYNMAYVHPNCPWRRTKEFAEYEGITRGKEIPNDYIRIYFQNLKYEGKKL